MPHRANDNFVVRQPPLPEEPDAHGQAALILTETILHALVDLKMMSTGQALDIVHAAQEIKTEVAALTGESKTRMNESLDLLRRIGISLEKDLDR